MFIYVGQYVIQHKWENRLKKAFTQFVFLILPHQAVL